MPASRGPPVGPPDRKGTSASSSSNSSKASSHKPAKEATIDAAVLAKLEKLAALYESAMATVERNIRGASYKYLYVSPSTCQQIFIDSAKDSTGKYAATAYTRPNTIKGEHIDRIPITDVKGFETEFDAKFALFKKVNDII